MKKNPGLFIILGLMGIACSATFQINTADTQQPAPQNTSTNIALNKPVTASSYWYFDEYSMFPPAAAVDGKTVEANCADKVKGGGSYWLLADQRLGWVQVDLGADYDISRIRWLNTHNGTCQDRATTRYHIEVSTDPNNATGGREVARGNMDIETNPSFMEKSFTPAVVGRYVRFVVDDYYRNGGGLNELEVYGTLK